MLEALGSQTNAQHHVVLAATGAPRLDPLTEGGVRGAIALGTGHRRLNKCAHNSDNGKDALHCLCIRDVRLNTNNSKNDTHTHTHFFSPLPATLVRFRVCQEKQEPIQTVRSRPCPGGKHKRPPGRLCYVILEQSKPLCFTCGEATEN